MKSEKKRGDEKNMNLVGSSENLFFENLVESDVWLTAIEAANYLRMTVNALRIATCRGYVPVYKIGRRSRYKLHELAKLPKLIAPENVLIRAKKGRN